jgi:tetratricopeptide (TPR) repeat protein
LKPNDHDDDDTDPASEGEAELLAALGALGAPRERSLEGASKPPVLGADPPLSDAEMIARVLERAAGGQAAPDRASLPPQAPPSRRMMQPRGVAVAFAAVALAASFLVAFASELRGLVSPQDGLEPTAEAGSDRALSPPLVAVPEAPVAAPLPKPAAPPAPQAAGHEEGARSPATEPAPPSADELLRRAQGLLHAGRTAEAMDAYRDLVARRPASGEARTALVSLGQLSLDQGRAEDALGYLDRYLAGPGSLHEEASSLRIETLGRLGRTAAEAAAIEDFLGRYPSSVHAERLRARREAHDGG